jgi:hypothetical protein
MDVPTRKAWTLLLALAYMPVAPAHGEDMGTSCEDCQGYGSPPKRHRPSQDVEAGPRTGQYPQDNSRLPAFAGQWVDPQDTEFRLRIERRGGELDMTGAMNTTLLVNGNEANATLREGCAPEYQHRGFRLADENRAGQSTVRLIQTGQTLRYEHRTNWFVPCADHRKGVEAKVHLLHRSNR